jgi:hypothetical protein
MTVLAFSAVLLFALLGRWQWHRAAEKRVLMAAFDAGLQAGASELGARTLAATPRYTLLRMRGRYDGAHQFLLDNISRDGVVGYEVLTPFVLEDGRIVVVNRGWLPLPGGGANRCRMWGCRRHPRRRRRRHYWPKSPGASTSSRSRRWPSVAHRPMRVPRGRSAPASRMPRNWALR